MGLLAAKLGAAGAVRARMVPVVEKTRRTLRERFSAGEVQWSPDFERILNLPRREKPDSGFVVEAMTQVLKKPEGTQRLREMQAWILYELSAVSGLIANAAVGSGKTLCNMLAPMVVKGCRRAVLLVPNSLLAQFDRDWKFYGAHWQLPNLAGGEYFTTGLPVLHVVAYSELSHAKSTTLLEQIKPDLIIADELHNLRNFKAARVSRFLRYLTEHDETKFCGWSGTLTARSVADYAHLTAIALEENSPLPLETSTVLEWAHALDADNEVPFEPGVLSRFCRPGEDVRSGFRRRLVDTLGFAASKENEIGTALYFRERRPPRMSDELIEHFRVLRRKPKDGGWKRPDGEELTTVLAVTNCARQLALGCYMRWRYPRGEPKELIIEWFEKRQSWNREVRAQLQTPVPHLDSPDLCRNAAARFYDGGCTGCVRGPQQDHEAGCSAASDHPLWPSYTFQAWRAIKNKVYYVRETVWVSDWVLQDAAAWACEEPGIVWVEHPEFGHKLAEISGMPYFGEGKEAAKAIGLETGTRSIIASECHSDGQNLQMFNRNLLTAFPSSAEVFEQIVGRTHRPGQLRDEVETYYYLHTREYENSKETALERAKYIHETMSPQKMVQGTWA